MILQMYIARLYYVAVCTTVSCVSPFLMDYLHTILLRSRVVDVWSRCGKLLFQQPYIGSRWGQGAFPPPIKEGLLPPRKPSETSTVLLVCPHKFENSLRLVLISKINAVLH